MRLTKKLEDKDMEFAYSFDCSKSINQAEAILKLGQLEDIEEEFGIDLITLFKALKKGCYAYQNGRIYKMSIVRIDSDEINHIILFRNGSYGGECYLLKDYGKTWALTKEELEK